jgi:hypothetical protein
VPYSRPHSEGDEPRTRVTGTSNASYPVT